MPELNDLSPNAGSKLTFNNGIAENERRETLKHGNADSAKGDMTMLNNYFKRHGLTREDLIEGHFGDPWPSIRPRLKQEWSAESLSEITRGVYLSRAKKFNTIVQELKDGINNDQRNIGEMLTMLIAKKRMDEPHLKKHEIASAVNMSHQLLSSWVSLCRNRHRATQTNMNRAHRLESYFGVEQGTLASRLTPIFTSSRPSARKISEEKYGKKDRVRVVEVPYRAHELPTKIKLMFDKLVDFKTSVVSKRNLGGSKMSTGRRNWRVKSSDKGICATARKKLINIQTYVGFLMLPADEENAMAFIRQAWSKPKRKNSKEFKPRRTLTDENCRELAKYFVGCGLRGEEIHPAHLIDPRYLERFVQWMHVRGHTNRKDFIDDALFLINEESGFLLQQVEYVWDYEWEQEGDYEDLILRGVDSSQDGWRKIYKEQAHIWHRICVFLRKDIRELTKAVPREDNVIEQKLQPILIKADLLKTLRDMISTHANDRPSARLDPGWAGSYHLAVWLRDQLLLRLLVSNPLRSSHFCTMTYREDNTGHLQNCSQRGWRLVYKAWEFKNQEGAAKKDYDVGVPQDLWPLVDEYVTRGRSILLRPDNPSDHVFLTKDGKPFIDGGISETVRKLTARFGDFDVETVGIRTHAFRHIIATAWLREHRNDYYTVAKILHDDIATVIRTYAHDSPDFALMDYHKVLRLPPLRLDDLRNAA